MRPNLTTKQAALYQKIVLAYENGITPTLRELAELTGISKVTVYEHVNALVKKGYLRRERYRARSLNPVEPIEDRYVSGRAGLLDAVTDLVQASYAAADVLPAGHEQLIQRIRKAAQKLEAIT